LNAFGEQVGRRKHIAHLKSRRAQMLLCFVLAVEGADLDEPSAICMRRRVPRGRGDLRPLLEQLQIRPWQVEPPALGEGGRDLRRGSRYRHWLSGRDNVVPKSNRRDEKQPMLATVPLGSQAKPSRAFERCFLDLSADQFAHMSIAFD
jgi:hypothetical protein